MKKSTLQTLSIILLIAWPSLGLGSELPCSARFRLLYDRLGGVELGSPVTLKGFESEDVRLLGVGGIGGHVYHVTPKDGAAPFVVKVYDHGGPVYARNDVLAFSFLNSAMNSSARPSNAIKSIRVLDQLDDLTLKLEYVSGIDLKKSGSRVNSVDREKLRRRFLEQLKELKARLLSQSSYSYNGQSFKFESKYEIENATDPTKFPALFGTFRNQTPGAKPAEVWLQIKADNVVLTPNGRFVIIDPF